MLALPLMAAVSPWLLVAVCALLFLGAVALLVVALVRSRRRSQPATDEVAWDAPAEQPAGEWETAPAFEAAPADAPAFEAAPEPAPEPIADAAPVSDEIHYCRCPACQAQFTVNGAKPIVTNCPGCGRKGFLR